MDQNFKLTSKGGSEFEGATKYKQLMGILIYLTMRKPNISFVVGILSRFMQKPCEVQWFATKRVLRYLKGSQDFGLKYSKVDDLKLIVYSYSEFDGDKEMRFSTSSYLMSIGSIIVFSRSHK